MDLETEIEMSLQTKIERRGFGSKNYQSSIYTNLYKPEVEVNAHTYRDWALYFWNKQNSLLALKYLTQYGDEEKDALLFYARSCALRDVADPRAALPNAKMATKLGTQLEYKLEKCNALREMNEFEMSHAQLYKFYNRTGRGNDKLLLKDYLCMDKEIFQDTLGESMGAFVLNNYKICDKVIEIIKKSRSVDNRPLWIQLKQQQLCDVTSILEKIETPVSPQRLAYRGLWFKIYASTYLNSNAKDVLFLKQLRGNEEIFGPEWKNSSPFLKQLLNKRIIAIKKLMKMLHSRNPLYNQRSFKSNPDPQRNRIRESYLFHVQLQTRRAMFAVLKKVHQLRKERKLRELSEYVEQVMGGYVVLKSYRVMPWKYEFIREVYNALALAHIDTYVVKTDILTAKNEDALHQLLHLPVERKVEDKVSVSKEDSEIDHQKIPLKWRKIYERRMHFSKFFIEKAYLQHEQADMLLTRGYYDQAFALASKAFKDAQHAISPAWQFLCVLMIVKTSTAQGQVERERLALIQAKKIARVLKNSYLIAFINLCICLNQRKIQEKIEKMMYITDMIKSYKRNTNTRQSSLSWMSLGNSMLRVSYDTEAFCRNSYFERYTCKRDGQEKNQQVLIFTSPESSKK